MAGVAKNISQQHAGTNRIATVIVIREFRRRTVNHFTRTRRDLKIDPDILFAFFGVFCNYSASSIGSASGASDSPQKAGYHPASDRIDRERPWQNQVSLRCDGLARFSIAI